MQPVLNFVFTVLSASTISDRRSPDNSGKTSRPRTSAPSASDSAANSWSKVSMSTSARSNFAQAFSRWLLALVRRMISAGNPRSLSNRANASNGEVVSTPPKSQITASIIDSPGHVDAMSPTANTVSRLEPVPALATRRLRSIAAAMKIPPHLLTILALLAAAPAHAIVGGGVSSAAGVGRSVVTIVGSRGNFCTGALIAPKLVLTAAHCVQPGADYKIVEYGADNKPLLRDVRTVAIHPAFNMQAMVAHRATADVALLQLEISPSGKSAATLGVPQIPIIVGSLFTIAGIGVTIRGEGSSGGTIRVAGLVATGQPGTLQIRLVDPLKQGAREGLGACTGDSGGPVFEDRQGGPFIIGVISWLTGPNASAGCGGLTGVTPLTLYLDWILQTARAWGSAL